MSPTKLFDYLDGKLPDREREELERQMADDPALRRELAMARRLHDGMRESPEVAGPAPVESVPEQRGAILSRRVFAAFGFLVFVNVCIGLYFIFRSQQKPAVTLPGERSVRHQVEQSAERAADSSLPLPKLESDEIKITVSADQTEALVKKIEAAATQAGGTAAKALADEDGTIVLADIPQQNETIFREQLVLLGAKLPPLSTNPTTPSPNERKYLQIRIVNPAPAPASS